MLLNVARLLHLPSSFLLVASEINSGQLRAWDPEPSWESQTNLLAPGQNIFLIVSASFFKSVNLYIIEENDRFFSLLVERQIYREGDYI